MEKGTPVDHVGLDLWRAARKWKYLFTSTMVAKGYPWYGEARGALIEFIPRGGISQRDLTTRAGLTKQAVQQHLDDLAGDGVIERVGDPQDARRKIVQYTPKGAKGLNAAKKVKIEIESGFIDIMGEKGFGKFRRRLAQLVDSQ